MSTSDLTVVAWGIAGSLRDAGRRGLAHVGRSRGGAVDLAEPPVKQGASVGRYASLVRSSQGGIPMTSERLRCNATPAGTVR